MIKRLFAQVVETISGPQAATAEDREAALRLATAVLIGVVVVMRQQMQQEAK